MAAAEDMAAEEVHTETGFGTGLRAKLGRAPEGEAEVVSLCLSALEEAGHLHFVFDDQDPHLLAPERGRRLMRAG